MRASLIRSGVNLAGSPSKKIRLDPNKLLQIIEKDENDLRSQERYESNEKSQAKTVPRIDGQFLTQYFSTASSLIIPQLQTRDITNVGRIIRDSNVSLDWSIYELKKLPGEEARSSDDTETINPIQKTENKGKILPEVIFLGRCNVGKSSLVNALMSSKKGEVTPYARVKQSAGYTPCLNFYNVGGLFRLVDSPGYGVKGKPWQGELTMEYLMKRRELCSCYLLLDGSLGLNQYDNAILEALVEMGSQFDVVFNKIDKVRAENRVKHFENIISDSMLSDLKIKPRFYFVNSVEGRQGDITDRTGIDELRYGILETCGYSDIGTLRPKDRKKPQKTTVKVNNKKGRF
ncbi:hypothetical protein OGAPHI_001295 [Ogataea philodendri]|uniref:EngB-type G domain-containing protein n=1 Tax=Ogataea philodendri TaxID=1378263 RepID=A0A9P8PG08_9ASCO|nr:uncharacterized protein OGAPHI_001295 [Ogataea philodendri]KAH3670779.1 hypothetical protein OGAPHI_001295 [Ogataea philodendri]